MTIDSLYLDFVNQPIPVNYHSQLSLILLNYLYWFILYVVPTNSFPDFRSLGEEKASQRFPVLCLCLSLAQRRDDVIQWKLDFSETAIFCICWIFSVRLHCGVIRWPGNKIHCQTRRQQELGTKHSRLIYHLDTQTENTFFSWNFFESLTCHYPCCLDREYLKILVWFGF